VSPCPDEGKEDLKEQINIPGLQEMLLSFYLLFPDFMSYFAVQHLHLKILVIEDEQGMRESMVASLLQEQYVVEAATDFYSAREKLEVYQYDCILLDIGLPGGNGFTLLEELKKQNNTEGVIIVSANKKIKKIV